MHLLCMMIGHRHDRRKVWDDGVTFRAPCRTCGQPQLRDPTRGWRPFDSDLDLRGPGSERRARPMRAAATGPTAEPPRRRTRR